MDRDYPEFTCGPPPFPGEHPPRHPHPPHAPGPGIPPGFHLHPPAFVPDPVMAGGDHRPPHHPPPGPGPFGGPFSRFPFPPPPGFGPEHGQGPEHGPPPLPITRDSFIELKQFFVLLILQGHEGGITGYQIQEEYQFPRGTILRILDELVENKHARTEETVEDGRNLKRYFITDAGKEYIEILKEKYTMQFALLSDLAPPEEYGFPFRRSRSKHHKPRDLGTWKTKEDAIDFLRGNRSMLKGLKDRLEERLEPLDEQITTVNTLIHEVETMDPFDPEKAKELVKSKIKRFFRRD